MIRLVCTHCKNVLTIDDAFAGGVCRCQHCGTIQTVPAAATGTGQTLVGNPVAGKTAGGTRALYQRDAQPGAVAGTGLDDLANIVVSSGLSSGRLTRGPAAAKPRPNLVPLFAVAGLVIVGLLAVIAFLATRPVNPTPTNVSPPLQNPGGRGRAGGPPSPPAFCKVPLAGATVIYLLDRGEATKDVVPALRDAALKSVESLGPDRKFQVLFWTIDADTPAYPEGDVTYASHENVAAARQAFGDVAAFGNTDLLPALALALAKQPDSIVVATGKEYGLDDAWVRRVLDARGSSTVRIDTFSVGNHGEVAALRDLAAKTGGTYRDVAETELTDAGR